MAEEIRMTDIETIMETKAASEAASLIGRKGGQATLRKYGKEHYSNLGKGSRIAAGRRKATGKVDERSGRG